MSKKLVFVSFDYDENKQYKFLLDAWNKNPDFEFTYEDSSSKEIQSSSIPVIKQALSRKINEATHTLVIVGKDAAKPHKDRQAIGYDNWQIYEIEKSIEHKNKIVAVKIDRNFTSPQSLLDSGVSWAMSFTQESIINALNKV